MRTALIGHTGLVGGNLLRQSTFTDCFNSRDIEAIAGQSFDLVVCAGAPAAKWRANQDPAADWENLQRLMRCLDAVQAKQIVLCSTIDVFAAPVGVVEYSPTDEAKQHAYGRHRHLLERFVAERFPCCLIVRLPGLFGPGLKKNVIFDLLHSHQLHAIDSRSVFQFYDLTLLWQDMKRFLDARLPLVHVATEPISVREVAHYAFGLEFDQQTTATPARYDFRSMHANRFGGSGGYLYSREQVLHAIRRFVNQARSQDAIGHLESGVAA